VLGRSGTVVIGDKGRFCEIRRMREGGMGGMGAEDMGAGTGGIESGGGETGVDTVGDGRDDGEVAGRDGGLVEYTEGDDRALGGKELGGGSGGNGGTGGRGDDEDEDDRATTEYCVIEDMDDLDGAGRGDRVSDSSSVGMDSFLSEDDASGPSVARLGDALLVSSAELGNGGTAIGSIGIDRLSLLSLL
jgi:hypothetical protein